MQPLSYRLVCRNSEIASDRELQKTHDGRSIVNENDAITVFKDDTLAMDDGL